MEKLKFRNLFAKLPSLMLVLLLTMPSTHKVDAATDSKATSNKNSVVLKKFELSNTNGHNLVIKAQFDKTPNTNVTAKIVGEIGNKSSINVNLDKDFMSNNYSKMLDAFEYNLNPGFYSVILSYNNTSIKKSINIKYMYFNQYDLSIIKVKGSDLRISKVNDNLSSTNYVGINGSFFLNSTDYKKKSTAVPALTTITVVNDKPIYPYSTYIDQKNPKDCVAKYDTIEKSRSSGWYNVEFGNKTIRKGTLIYDGDTNKFSIRAIKDASNIDVTNRKNYWAIGGISLSLKKSNWEQIANEEGLKSCSPILLGPRSAIVYDDKGYAYLIVTNTNITNFGVMLFRAHIIAFLSNHNIKNADGILLDGSGSSQMNSAYYNEKGTDMRKIPTAITIK